MRERIAEIIEKENLTSARFANLIGIQPSAVSHILSGRNNPSLDVAQKILNTFRTLNSDWLILGVGPMYREIGKQAEKQDFNIKNDFKQSQMPSLFPGEWENEPKYGKENESNQDKKNPSFEIQEPKPYQQSQKPSENRISFETPSKEYGKEKAIIQPPPQPVKAIKNIIVYYTDNTFEEYRTFIL